MSNQIIAELSCTYEERLSARSGKPYNCIVVKIAEGIEKLVFLSPSEAKLLELQFNR